MKNSIHSINCLPIPLLVFDENLELLEASRGAYEVMNLPLCIAATEEGIQNLSDAISDQLELITGIGSSTMKIHTPGSTDTFIWEKETEIYNVAVTCSLNKKEETQIFYVSIEDISDKIEYKQGRDSARLYLERIMECLPVGLVVTDKDLKVTEINHANHKILIQLISSESILEIIGTQISNLLPETIAELNWGKLRNNVIEGGRSYSTGFRYLVENEECFYNFTASPLKDHRDIVQGVVIIIEDITEQKRLEEELKEAELFNARFKTLRQIAVALNHEINNSLTTIMINTQMMINFPDVNKQEQRSSLNSIVEKCESIQKVTQYLNDLKNVPVKKYIEGCEEEMLDTDVLHD